MLRWTQNWKVRRGITDAEAIALLGSHDAETAYQTARGLMRVARDKGDRTMEDLYAKVAVRITDVTGRIVGPKAYDENRYQSPLWRIDGDQIVKADR